MDNTTSLPPHMLKKFAELATYLGKAQKVAREISQGNLSQLQPTIPDLTPPENVPPSDAWFWSSAWQAKEQAANDSLVEGDYTSFGDADEAIGYLHEQA